MIAPLKTRLFLLTFNGAEREGKMKHRRRNIVRRKNTTTGRRRSTSKQIALILLAALAVMMVYGLVVIAINRPEQNSFSAPVEVSSGITLPEDPVKRTLSYDRAGNPVFFDEENGISATYHEEIDTLVFTKTAPGDGIIRRSREWVGITNDQRQRLKEIVFGDGISEIFAVEFDRFSNYSSLQTIIFKGNIEKIGDFAFSQSENLRTVRFEGECHEIGEGAFVDCKGLTKDSINIPKGCNIAPNAFLRTALDVTSTDEKK